MSKLFVTPVADVREGTRLIADSCFTCIAAGAVLTVQRDVDGDLYVPCAGPEDEPEPGCHHGLDGQLSHDGKYYVGFLPAEAA